MVSRLVQRVSSVLWPAFMVAAAAELVFFGLVDPMDLQVFDSLQADGDRTSAYSLGFLFFWCVGVVATVIHDVLNRPAAEINRFAPPVSKGERHQMSQQRHALHH